MPNLGDPCEAHDTVALSDSGEILVCRRGVWQGVGDAPPLPTGALPSRVLTERLIDEHARQNPVEGESDG